MINEITIEGIVTREPWSYDKDIFFRVACYRDMDLPAKPDTSSPGRDEPDYVNIRYPGGAGSLFSSACAVNGLPAAGKSVRRGSS
jgi:hypothetical protein